MYRWRSRECRNYKSSIRNREGIWQEMKWELLNDDQRALLIKVKNYTDEVISVNYQKYEISGEFPYPLFQEICHLGVFELLKQENNNDDLTFFECIRIIASGFPALASIVLTQGSYIIYPLLQFGNHEQQNKFLKDLMTGHKIGGLALTEPDHGSDIAGGLATTAERKGDKWILNGEKRWIGGADTADIVPVFARDVEDGKIKCFIVRKGAPGYKADPVPQKISLRCVQNGHITMENVEVPDADRLPNINTSNGGVGVTTETLTKLIV